MTIEEIRKLNSTEIEERLNNIAVEIEAEDADLEALSAEVDALKEHRESLIKAEETRKRLAEDIANGNGKIVEERKEEVKMDNMEIRNSAAYIDAFANYIKPLPTCSGSGEGQGVWLGGDRAGGWFCSSSESSQPGPRAAAHSP